MSIRWSKLAGNTEEFAIELSLTSDPDKGRGEDPDIATAWGSLSLWAGGANITAHSDGEGTYDSVSWYLLPLLEWVVDGWDALLHEERLPCRVIADDAASALVKTAFPPRSGDAAWEEEWGSWWRRHSIQRARHGGPFPDVVLRRWRSQVEISWRNVTPAGIPPNVRFLATSGAVRCDPKLVADALHSVISEVAVQLAKDSPDSKRMARLVASVKALRTTDAHAVRVGWLAGLARASDAAARRYRDLTERVRAEVPSVADLFEPTDSGELVVGGSCHGTLLFGSMAPTIRSEDVVAVATAMAHATAASAEADTVLERLTRPVPVGLRRRAWEQGFELAEEIRDALDLGEAEIPDDLEALLGSLGVALSDHTFSDRKLRAVSFVGPTLAATTMINTPSNSHPARRRFTVAHELCHLLFDGDQGARLAIASGPWAPRDVERRANAFAAAFLMPPAAVEEAVKSATMPVSEMAGVDQVASHLRASKTATIERLHDLGYLDEVEQEMLKDSF